MTVFSTGSKGENGKKKKWGKKEVEGKGERRKEDTEAPGEKDQGFEKGGRREKSGVGGEMELCFWFILFIKMNI